MTFCYHVPVAIPDGGGGDPFFEQGEDNEVLVGLHVWAGDMIDAVQALFAPVLHDGSLGQVREGKKIGGNGGQKQRLYQHGSAVTGLMLRIGDVTDQLQIRWHDWKTGQESKSEACGSNGGEPLTMLVDKPTWVIGIHGNCGDLVDRISLITAHWNEDGVPTSCVNEPERNTLLIEYAPFGALDLNEDDSSPAMNVLDWESDSIWHSSRQQHGQFPQGLFLMFEGIPFITALAYTPRQDGNNEGNITQYVIEASADGSYFFEVARGSWPDNAETKIVCFERQQVSRLRLIALQGVGGYASACKIKAYSSRD